MKIALITTEYPPEKDYGGIAIYMKQIAEILLNRNHCVEVFTVSDLVEGKFNENGVIVNKVKMFPDEGIDKIRIKISECFYNRNKIIKFHVLESHEINAITNEIIKKTPDIPLVIKLHTPSFLLHEICYVKPSMGMQFRRVIGALKRFKLPNLYKKDEYIAEHDIECLHTHDADLVTTPSIALGEIIKKRWNIPNDKLFHLPNPYKPDINLLNINNTDNYGVVTFVGKVEMRKGVTDLFDSIPYVLQEFPNIKFIIVGPNDWPSPDYKLNMKEYAIKKLKKYAKSVMFLGKIDNNEIYKILAKSDICVFPSVWENFPNVCLEAMSSARGIIGSSAGGMNEMLDNGKVGLLVPPKNPLELSKAIIKLLQNPNFRKQLGIKARNRVLDNYNEDLIGSMQEESYKRAIEHRKNLGARQNNYVI